MTQQQRPYRGPVQVGLDQRGLVASDCLQRRGVDRLSSTLKPNEDGLDAGPVHQIAYEPHVSRAAKQDPLAGFAQAEREAVDDRGYPCEDCDVSPLERLSRPEGGFVHEFGNTVPEVVGADGAVAVGKGVLGDGKVGIDVS